MNIIEDQIFDEERALYNLKNTTVKKCFFEGPNDGESALKETRNIEVISSSFSLRYPIWHADCYLLKDCIMKDTCRAPIWYSNNGVIDNCKINGIKTLRECNFTKIINSEIDSKEFGWKCNNIEIYNSRINSEYLLFDSNDVTIDSLEMTGKYSFQYMNNLIITNSNLDTKDAFWHSKNVTVKDSIIKGEYLGWFSENLTLINCKIIGTQPLCYCKNLKLINCTTEGCDLAFEYSDVEADIIGNIMSIKNPLSGIITVDSVDEQIFENSITKVNGKIVIRKKD